MAAVTGWWGCGNEEQVGLLAKRCQSTWKTPLYNDVVFNAQSPLGWTTCTYFLLFGKCRSVTWPSQPSFAQPHSRFPFGDDLRQALVSVQFMPWWERGFARDGMQNSGKSK